MDVVAAVAPDTRTTRARRRDRRREVRRPKKIRYTAAEWAAIVMRARECGRPPASYVREVSLGAVPKVARTRSNAALVRELGRIIVALSEAAAYASEHDATSVTGAADAARTDLLAVVRRLG